ncbi:cytochrome P450 [Ktedonosporobacter rubrisoli]|uniref:Cytochrome P450 n=1 Tax=Ktedonosporobacter rubrisoli TaxID=2509675 RepID=A0A4P6JJA9_KTERU|nr:cytochrome P450 [Ktedonosporobacter rubrisoli]QBD75010.1 cytochrome P450 [Ktedonosporobacter rubrisoli]
MQIPSFVREYTLPPLEWQRAMRTWSKTMRQDQPVCYDEQVSGWRLFRYEDILQVQNDYKTFSSEPVGGESLSIIGMDPPRHSKLRALVTPAFSARTIAQLAPRVQQIAQEMLANALPAGKMEMVADFASPFPIFVITDLLGLPAEKRPYVKAWTDALATGSLPFEEVGITMAQAIEEHRQKPREDILSLLLNAEVDGQHLTEYELLGFILTLLIAGNLTTTQLLGNAILCFDEHPEAWDQLRQDRSLLASAVEEILRCLPPNRGTGGDRTIIGGRIATTDVEVGGKLIRRGEEIYVTTISANFDEQQFSDPERFDIRRTPNRHISFGHGIHFCLGAPLARLQTKIALDLMLDMIPDWRLSHDVPLKQIENPIVFGAQKLPLTFSSSRSMRKD